MKKCFIAITGMLFCMLLFQCYYVRQGVVLFDIYSGAEPIQNALLRTNLAEDERRALELVLEIKRFAVEKLSLAENSNYSTYIRLDRDHLADIVSACESLSFRQYEWDYPFVGKLPYKGFFSRSDADREAGLLAQAGYDVHVRKVDAFSTLGWFSDPIFSFMKDYPAYAFAELIIHEQSHATVFIPGAATFNENFALFVGRQGMREFLLEKYGAQSREYRLALVLEEDHGTFVTKIDGLYRVLEDLYNSPLPGPEKLQRKTSLIEDWKKRFADSYHDDFQSTAYENLPAAEINNALIMTYRNYIEQQPDMERLFQLAGENLPRFIRCARDLKSDAANPLKDFEELILAQEGQGGRSPF